MSNKIEKEYGKPRKWTLVLAAALAALLILLVGLMIQNQTQKDDPQSAAVSAKEEPGQIQRDTDVRQTYSLGEGLEITDVGSYTGVYMEDGSDEVVTGVMMIIVSNTSDKALEYAEITLSGGAGEGRFTVSALPTGESVVLLEKNRKPYASGVEYSQAKAENIAFFQSEISLMADELKIQPLDGGVNVTNISDRDIDGDIFICYKNEANGLLYGGIAYRVRIEGGLKAGEIRQIMTNHFSDSGTALIYVSVT